MKKSESLRYIMVGAVCLVSLSAISWHQGWANDPRWWSGAVANGVGNLIATPLTVVITVLLTLWQLKRQQQIDAQVEEKRQAATIEAKVRAYVEDALREVVQNFAYLEQLRTYFEDRKASGAMSSREGVNVFRPASIIAAGIRSEALGKLIAAEVRVHLPADIAGMIALLESAYNTGNYLRIRLERVATEMDIYSGLPRNTLIAYYNGASSVADIESEVREDVRLSIRVCKRHTALAGKVLGATQVDILCEANDQSGIPGGVAWSRFNQW